MVGDTSNLKRSDPPDRVHLRRRLTHRTVSSSQVADATPVDLAIAQQYRTPFFSVFRRQWQLYAMILLPVLFIAIFMYGPMFGIVVAFKDYSFRRGILGSEWVGLRYFRQFLTTPLFYSTACSGIPLY